jgi:hypothetical protein
MENLGSSLGIGSDTCSDQEGARHRADYSHVEFPICIEYFIVGGFPCLYSIILCGLLYRAILQQLHEASRQLRLPKVTVEDRRLLAMTHGVGHAIAQTIFLYLRQGRSQPSADQLWWSEESPPPIIDSHRQSYLDPADHIEDTRLYFYISGKRDSNLLQINSLRTPTADHM